MHLKAYTEFYLNILFLPRMLYRVEFAADTVYCLTPQQLSNSLNGIINVWAFPPRESCNRRVSFESRYGICVICLALLISPRAEIKELDEALEHIIFVDGAKNEWGGKYGIADEDGRKIESGDNRQIS